MGVVVGKGAGLLVLAVDGVVEVGVSFPSPGGYANAGFANEAETAVGAEVGADVVSGARVATTAWEEGYHSRPSDSISVRRLQLLVETT